MRLRNYRPVRQQEREGGGGWSWGILIPITGPIFAVIALIAFIWGLIRLGPKGILIAVGIAVLVAFILFPFAEAERAKQAAMAREARQAQIVPEAAVLVAVPPVLIPPVTIPPSRDVPPVWGGEAKRQGLSSGWTEPKVEAPVVPQEDPKIKAEQKAARQLLNLGRNYENSGLYDFAATKFKEVLVRYPDAEVADECKERLDDLRSRKRTTN